MNQLHFDSDREADMLCEALAYAEGPVAVDTETVNWEPGDPLVGPTAPLPVCATLAGEHFTAFVRLEGRPALCSALALALGTMPHLVGANTSFDLHALNHPSLAVRPWGGGELATLAGHFLAGGGEVTDVLVMSRAESATRRGHDLKSLGAELLGRNPPSFKRMRQEVFGLARTKPTKRCPEGRPYADERPNEGRLDEERCLNHQFFRAYAMHDARNTFDLLAPLEESLRRQGALEPFNRLVRPMSRRAFLKELRGVPVSLDSLKSSGDRARAQREVVRAKLDAAAPGVLWTSPTQVKAALGGLGLELESTASASLIEWRDTVLEDGDPRGEVLHDLLEFRGVDKQIVAFFDKLPRGVHEGRVHPSLRVHGAQTGRDACANPNAQQMSATKDVWKLRHAFQTAPSLAAHRAALRAGGPRPAYTDPGRLCVVADFSAIEWVLAIHVSGDQAMAEAHAQGWDAHSYTAYKVFEEVRKWVDARGGPSKANFKAVKKAFPEKRQACKTLNYAQLYGSGARTLRLQLLQSGDIVDGVRSPGVDMPLEQVEEMVEGWCHTYSGYDQWRRKLVVDIRRACLGGPGERGVRTIGGRLRQADADALRCFNHPAKELRWRAGAEGRSLVSAAIQGSAADLLHLSEQLVEDDSEMRLLGYSLLLPVHDELFGTAPAREARRAAHRKRTLMLEAARLLGVRPRVEASAGWGRSWGTAK